MNRLTIIGNLTRDPETRTTQSGKTVCTFTVAVNRRGSGQQEADFFRVSAWNALGENCGKYLAKGRKVAVVGSVSVETFESNKDGKTYATLQVMASEVEFLSAAGTAAGTAQEAPADTDDQTGFSKVESDDLPF